MSASAVDSLFAAPLHASAGPAARTERFPIVLVAQGNSQDAIDQVILCEYLASHGFIVATTPSPMLRVRMEREDQAGDFAEMQALDLKNALKVVAGSLPVDTGRVAVVGHSFGSRPALLLAMNNPNVRALVSLDGGIGTSTASEPFRRAKSFRRDAMIPPLLHFYEDLDSFMAPDFALVRSLRTSSVALVRTTDLHHVHFTTYGLVVALVPEIAKATKASDGTVAAFAGIYARTVEFLGRSLGR